MAIVCVGVDEQSLPPAFSDTGTESGSGNELVSEHGAQTRDHGAAEAKRIIAVAEKVLEVSDWAAMKKGDWRKGLVAGLIRRRSLIDNGWLAKHLEMGARSAVSRIMRQADEHIQSDRTAMRIGRRLERELDKG